MSGGTKNPWIGTKNKLTTGITQGKLYSVLFKPQLSKHSWTLPCLHKQVVNTEFIVIECEASILNTSSISSEGAGVQSPGPSFTHGKSGSSSGLYVSYRFSQRKTDLAGTALGAVVLNLKHFCGAWWGRHHLRCTVPHSQGAPLVAQASWCFSTEEGLWFCWCISWRVNCQYIGRTLFVMTWEPSIITKP